MTQKVHVKKGDTVVVIAGKDKGKQGKVLRVLPDEGRVTVEGVNMVKRHQKPRPPKVMQGGIIEKEAALAASNVMVYCPKCRRPVRTGTRVLEGDQRVRVCVKCGENLDK